MERASGSLEYLFDPSSIAVVGASPDSWYSSRLMNNVFGGSSDRSIFPVNPKYDSIEGHTCYDSLSDIPHEIDLVVVSIPREVVPGVIREAGELGIPTALVVTAGFGEADELGAKLEDELVRIVDRFDIRIAGPQSLGIANIHEDLILSPGINRDLEPGSMGIVSQSGGFAVTLLERGADQDVHSAYVVSTGNEIDLTVSDYIDYLADRPSVDVICSFVEGIEDPRRYMETIDRAVRDGTPVFTIKIGRSEAAKSAAMSHTGSVIGDNAAWDGAFAQTGVQRVTDLPALLDRAKVQTHLGEPESNDVCVVTTSGGYAGLIADLATERNLVLPDLSEESKRKLHELDALLAFDELRNPVDIRGYGLDALPEIADVVFADDSFSSYVFVYELSAVDDDAARVASDFVTIAENATNPVVFLWAGSRESDNDRLSSEPLPYEKVRTQAPLFSDAEPCLDALSSLVEFGDYRAGLDERPTRTDLLEEVEAEKPEFDLPPAHVLDWSMAASLLEVYDIEVVDTRVVNSAVDAEVAAGELGFPVVLKVDSTEVVHRSRAGAVKTDVETGSEAREAYRAILDNVESHDPEASIEGVLVQPQVAEGVEVMVGISTDDVFGSLVTVATGGTLVEVIDDSSTRDPPISIGDATELVEETAIDALLSERLDEGTDSTDDLKRLIEAVGRLAIQFDSIKELDLNPVIVTSDGPVVVDILARTDSG